MNYFERLKKAIFLDVAFYEEVEKDKKFNDQALMTVAFVSVVRVFVIDCTEIGLSPPTFIFPTLISFVFLLLISLNGLMLIIDYLI